MFPQADDNSSLAGISGKNKCVYSHVQVSDIPIAWVHMYPSIRQINSYQVIFVVSPACLKELPCLPRKKIRTSDLAENKRACWLQLSHGGITNNPSIRQHSSRA